MHPFFTSYLVNGRREIMRENNNMYKIIIYILGIISILAVGCLWIWSIWNKVPSNIRVRAGEGQGLEFYVPATATIYKKDEQGQVNVDLNQKLTIYGKAEDTYTMDVDLFGFIPFKQSEVYVIQEKRIVPLGIPVGIYVQSDGILVVDTGEFTTSKGKKESPAKNLLQPGDYIVTINQKEIYSKEVLMDEISSCKGKSICLGVRRDGSYLTVNLILELVYFLHLEYDHL